MMFGFKTISTKPESIAAALRCEGWSTEAQLGLIYDLLQQVKKVDGDILEIGSAWGRSAVLMGLASNKQIWSIDPHTGGIAFIKRGENQNSFEGFKKNLENNKLTSRINILRYTTQEVMDKKLMPDKQRLAFAFIDGLHTADGVRVDIDFVIPRLSKGAIVLFDDYFSPSVADMKEMIDLKANEYNLTLIKDETTRLVYFTF